MPPLYLELFSCNSKNSSVWDLYQNAERYKCCRPVLLSPFCCCRPPLLKQSLRTMPETQTPPRCQSHHPNRRHWRDKNFAARDRPTACTGPCSCKRPSIGLCSCLGSSLVSSRRGGDIACRICCKLRTCLLRVRFGCVCRWCVGVDR